MKKNTQVTVMVKGVATIGKVDGVREKNGQWIDVNITPDAKPKDKVIKSFRPKAVTKV